MVSVQPVGHARVTMSNEAPAVRVYPPPSVSVAALAAVNRQSQVADASLKFTSYSMVCEPVSCQVPLAGVQLKPAGQLSASATLASASVSVTAGASGSANSDFTPPPLAPGPVAMPSEPEWLVMVTRAAFLYSAPSTGVNVTSYG